MRKIKSTLRLAKMIMDFSNVSFFRALKEASDSIKQHDAEVSFENEANR